MESVAGQTAVGPSGIPLKLWNSKSASGFFGDPNKRKAKVNARETARIHQPLKEVSEETIRVPSRLKKTCVSVMIATAMICVVGPGSCPSKSPLITNRHVPTLIAASTVTSPARLNHAANQPIPRPPNNDAQWYIPPAVGKAEAIWAMVAATQREKTTAKGQPIPIAAGPTAQNPR